MSHERRRETARKFRRLLCGSQTITNSTGLPGLELANRPPRFQEVSLDPRPWPKVSSAGLQFLSLLVAGIGLPVVVLLLLSSRYGPVAAPHAIIPDTLPKDVKR